MLRKSLVSGMPAIPRSRREAEMLRLLRDGKTTREAAEELSISFHTVETHRKNLTGKFGVNNIISVIKMAAEYQLLKQHSGSVTKPPLF